MTSISNAFNKMNTKWANQEQPAIMEATISALGSSSESYTITLKNGSKVQNISGPSGLYVGSRVVIANYPGRTKKYVILQTSKGSGTQSPTVVVV